MPVQPLELDGGPECFSHGNFKPFSAALVLGGTGNLPVPPGYQPGGMNEAVR